MFGELLHFLVSYTLTYPAILLGRVVVYSRTCLKLSQVIVLINTCSVVTSAQSFHASHFNECVNTQYGFLA